MRGPERLALGELLADEVLARWRQVAWDYLSEQLAGAVARAEGDPVAYCRTAQARRVVALRRALERAL